MIIKSSKVQVNGLGCILHTHSKIKLEKVLSQNCLNLYGNIFICNFLEKIRLVEGIQIQELDFGNSPFVKTALKLYSIDKGELSILFD